MPAIAAKQDPGGGVRAWSTTSVHQQTTNSHLRLRHSCFPVFTQDSGEGEWKIYTIWRGSKIYGTLKRKNVGFSYKRMYFLTDKYKKYEDIWSAIWLGLTGVFPPPFFKFFFGASEMFVRSFCCLLFNIFKRGKGKKDKRPLFAYFFLSRLSKGSQTEPLKPGKNSFQHPQLHTSCSPQR